MIISDLADHIYACERVSSNNIPIDTVNDLIQFINDQQMHHHAHPAWPNMGSDPPSGFLYNLQRRLRWYDPVGEISILRCDHQIIGISCVERSGIHPQLSIGGIRCWVDRQHRTKQLMTKYLLSANLNWSKDREFAGMLLTFNHYNRWIYNTICRAANGRSISLGNVWSRWWTDCIPILQPLVIRHTEQWCVIKPISPNIFNIMNEICFDE